MRGWLWVSVGLVMLFFFRGCCLPCFSAFHFLFSALGGLFVLFVHVFLFCVFFFLGGGGCFGLFRVVSVFLSCFLSGCFWVSSGDGDVSCFITE